MLFEVTGEGIEQATGALFAVRAVRPEAVEEHAVFDVREPGAVGDLLELETRQANACQTLATGTG